jgi:glycine cleavage system aminomethyltransferase T
VSLDFLTPTPSAKLPARGPLLDAFATAGAVCEVRGGWELAVSFGSPEAEAAACAEAVGFAELPHLSKLELQSSGPPTLAAALGGEVGEPARRVGDGWLCLEAPSLALAIGVETGSLAELELPCRVTDLTAALGAVVIAGPLARDLLARFSAIDAREASLPVAGFRPISVARTPGFVLREADDRFLVLFGAALGEYVWEVLDDAARRLGGRAVGLDALPAIAAPAHEEVASDA